MLVDHLATKPEYKRMENQNYCAVYTHKEKKRGGRSFAFGSMMFDSQESFNTQETLFRLAAHTGQGER